jgi:AbrB family looped-hinge helix DNA binding protein
VPREIRDCLGLKAGDKLTFTLLSDGTVIMRAKTKPLADLSAPPRSCSHTAHTPNGSTP